MPIQAKYAHTNLTARDWRRLARFYCEVFNCVPKGPERDLSGLWLDELTRGCAKFSEESFKVGPDRAGTDIPGGGKELKNFAFSSGQHQGGGTLGKVHREPRRDEASAAGERANDCEGTPSPWGLRPTYR